MFKTGFSSAIAVICTSDLVTVIKIAMFLKGNSTRALTGTTCVLEKMTDVQSTFVNRYNDWRWSCLSHTCTNVVCQYYNAQSPRYYHV